MPQSLLYPLDCKSVAAMQSDRIRMRAELIEVIAGAKETVARSRALLAEVDAILAREKFVITVPQVSFFGAGR